MDTYKAFTPEQVEGKMNTDIIFAVREDQGPRSSMEDRHIAIQLDEDSYLCVVLDGHGGTSMVRLFAASIRKSFRENLANISVDYIRDTIMELDKNHFERYNMSGTTLSGVIVTSDKIYTINIGDSRTVLLCGKNVWSTKDHSAKDKDEKEAVIKRGGYITYRKDTPYVSFGQGRPSIAVTRALGDYSMKLDDNNGYMGEQSIISPVPDVTEHHRKCWRHIVIGCDGIFGEIDNVDVEHYLSQTNDVESVADHIMRHTESSRDNRTLIVFKLPHRNDTRIFKNPDKLSFHDYEVTKCITYSTDPIQLNGIIPNDYPYGNETSTGTNILCRSIEANNYVLTKYLLEDKGKHLINCADSKGKTPLILAIELCEYDTTDMLLEHGADPNIKFKRHKSPLGIAIEQGETDVAIKLIEHGAAIHHSENRRAKVVKMIESRLSVIHKQKVDLFRKGMIRSLELLNMNVSEYTDAIEKEIEKELPILSIIVDYSD